jgi:hypothetical protein
LFEHYGKRPDAAKKEAHQVAPIMAVVVHGPDGPRAFGAWRVQTITHQAIEQFRAVRLASGRRPAAVNRNLACLRAFFKWAALAGHVPATPFKVGGERR